MADQCYFTDANGRGNYYQALAPTTVGQSPATSPTLWSKVQIPANWRWVLAKLTYANLLEMDGQKDKGAAERQEAQQDERRGLDRLVMDEANREQFLQRPNVTVRR